MLFEVEIERERRRANRRPTLHFLGMALRCFDSQYMMSCRLAMVATIVLIACAYSASATQYEVGNTAGWGLGNDLQQWSSQLTFNVGDDLYFSYPTGQHSVLLVTEDDYNSCNTENPVTSDGGQGNMLYTLSNAEVYYFICGVEGHCGQGLKLTVTVVAAPSTSTGGSPVLTPPVVDHSPPDTPSSTPYSTPYNTFHYKSGAAPPNSKLKAAMAAIVGAATALAYTCLVS